jgi:hypothetical protein
MMDFHVVSFQKTLIEYKLLVVHMFDEHTTNDFVDTIKACEVWMSRTC